MNEQGRITGSREVGSATDGDTYIALTWGVWSVLRRYLGTRPYDEIKDLIYELESLNVKHYPNDKPQADESSPEANDPAAPIQTPVDPTDLADDPE